MLSILNLVYSVKMMAKTPFFNTIRSKWDHSFNQYIYSFLFMYSLYELQKPDKRLKLEHQQR